MSQKQPFAIDMRYRRGDRVLYIGPATHIQEDYGHRVLIVVGVDPITQSVACRTECGLLLVGVPSTDLDLLS